VGQVARVNRLGLLRVFGTALDGIGLCVIYVSEIPARRCSLRPPTRQRLCSSGQAYIAAISLKAYSGR